MKMLPLADILAGENNIGEEALRDRFASKNAVSARRFAGASKPYRQTQNDTAHSPLFADAVKTAKIPGLLNL